MSIYDASRLTEIVASLSQVATGWHLRANTVSCYSASIRLRVCMLAISEISCCTGIAVDRKEAAAEYKGSPCLQDGLVVELQDGQLLKLADAVKLF